jgi:hypothetical protein
MQERVERKLSFCMIDKSKAEMAALRLRLLQLQISICSVCMEV